MLAAGWCAVAAAWWLLAVPRLRRGPTGRAWVGLLWHVSRWWIAWRHRGTIEGLHHLRACQGPILIAANHTGAIDPLLVQAGTSRIIRWMMARDMMGQGLDALWEAVEVIPVDRAGPDTASLRAALRTLKQGGCVGVFPEGRITRPPCTIRPFQEGVGMLASRSGATVIPCWISNTPDVDGVVGSILSPSRSSVVLLEPVRYDRTNDPASVAEDLRQRLIAASGWPAVNESMPLVLPE